MTAKLITDVSGPKRVVLLFWRALTLRCPACGAWGLFRSWFRLHERCPRCGLRLERGEHDYFLGSMMFNLVVAELIYVTLVVLFIVWRWPDVPWDFLQYGGVLFMIAAPFLLFPLSKTIWLAFDLMLRRPRADDFR
ncbi:MAG TPA: DUF983 domain-containing protein [Gemmatimonadaceae bacterium]|jgi:uncharacterized protein (DUF983 family)|nr:DUF983 domain-containing protein [Gemmatimonadaceae bacterium]